jgi:photosystem II stability/assembly factor-like uncharacterized protein
VSTPVAIGATMFDTYIGAAAGVFRLRDGSLEPLGLESERVSGIHADGDTILAGTYGNGLFRSADGGRTWASVDVGAPAFRFFAPDRSGALLAGTEPARLFRSADGGASWDGLDGITAIEGHEDWFLPYSPRAGAARNVYVRGDRLLVAAEVAGLLRSEDGGETWVCEPVAGDDDLHFVLGHPDDPDLLYAATGFASLRSGGGPHGGVARSRDGGATWEKIESDYTRALLIPPARPDLLLAGPAPRVERGGRIVVSADGGDTWERAAAGVETPMPDMVERFLAAPDESVWAICSAGRLLRTPPDEWAWSSALPAGAELAVESVAFVAPR